MPRIGDKTTAFSLKDYDKAFLRDAPDDFFAWCRFYFQDWEPFPYQEYFYTAPQKDKLLIAGVRTGKTQGVAAAFLHYAWRYPNKRVANASLSADQANVVYNDCLSLASRNRFQHWVRKVERHPYPKIIFENDTEIWFRSVGYEAELWRGWEFDWINIDEAAYITHEMAIRTLQGRLLGVGRDGIFTMTSTPKGKGWLYERWKKGDPHYPLSEPDKYLSMRARTRDNTLLLPEDIDRLEEGYTQRLKMQELEGIFLDSSDTIFPVEQVIEACSTIHPEVVRMNEQVKHWLLSHRMGNVYFGAGELTRYELEPQEGHHYLVSWDLGKKTSQSGRGATVGGVLDISTKPWELVGYRWESGAGYLRAIEWIKEYHLKYGMQGKARCETIIDATGKGDVVNEELEERERIGVDGIVYSGATKPQLIHAAQLMFERRQVRMPFIKRLVDQFQSYELDDKELPQDIVMMLAQAAFRARQMTGDMISKEVKKAVIANFHRPDVSMDRYNKRRRMMRPLPGRPRK